MNKKLATLGAAAGLTLGATAIVVGAGAGAEDSVTVRAGAPAVAGATGSTGATGATGERGRGSDRSDRPDPASRLGEILAPLVKDKTINQSQADAVVKAITDAGPGPGGQGPGGDRMRGQGMGGGHDRPGLDAAATALGMTVDELRTQLESGSSIAEIATTKSIDVNTIIDALVAEAKTHLDQAVADGKVTQDEATKRLDDMRTRITAMVNGEAPARPKR
jgi:polyhydroxyalkanoate synthesis regulator phasin